MKAVGEVMAIGRSFQEALQKACQSLEIKRNGLGADGRELRDQDAIMQSSSHPSWNRLFHLYDAIKLGIPMKTIFERPRSIRGSCAKSKNSLDFEKDLAKHTIQDVPTEVMRGQAQGVRGPSNRPHPQLLGVGGAHTSRRRSASPECTSWWTPALRSSRH